MCVLFWKLWQSKCCFCKRGEKPLCRAETLFKAAKSVAKVVAQAGKDKIKISLVTSSDSLVLIHSLSRVSSQSQDSDLSFLFFRTAGAFVCKFPHTCGVWGLCSWLWLNRFLAGQVIPRLSRDWSSFGPSMQMKRETTIFCLNQGTESSLTSKWEYNLPFVILNSKLSCAPKATNTAIKSNKGNLKKCCKCLILSSLILK